LFALDDYQRYEAISNLPLSGDMKPSKLMSNMLALLPLGHKPCFFLRGAFLKRLPADVRAHLLRDDFSDPIALALKADEIYQSRVSSSTVYMVSTIIVPGELKPRNVEPRVPGRETSLPAGGCSYPSCRAFYHFSSHLPAGFPEFKEIPH